MPLGLDRARRLEHASRMSYPELASVGGAALWVAVALLVAGLVCGLGSFRRLGLGLGLAALILFALTAIAVSDAFCLAGYRADDGSCAWE